MKVAVVMAATACLVLASSSPDHHQEPNLRAFYYAPPGFFNPYSPYEISPHPDPIVSAGAAPSVQDLEDERQAQEQLAELKRLYAQQEMSDGPDHQRLLLPSITYVGHSVSLSTTSFISLLKKLASSLTTKTVTVLIPILTTIERAPLVSTTTTTISPSVVLPGLTTEVPETTDSSTDPSFF